MNRLFRFSVAALLLCCSSALAATRTYDAEASAVPQIDSITVANTWAAGDTGSVTIGNATITFTCGADTTTTAQVASVIRNMINATSIDNNLVGAETRTAAGQLVGEFRDVEAVIDPANTSKVLVRSRVAGVPFFAVGGSTLTVAESTAGSGTLTAASVQAATGPWHWNNAKNWSDNTAPVNDDTAVFQATANGPKYGLPNGSLEVTLNVYQDFTGDIGLPFKNALGYSEYRQRYVRLDDAGSGTNIQHRFGLESTRGAGSPRIHVKHTAVACTTYVYATGTPASGEYALNLCCGHASSVLSVLKGSVNASSQDGQTAAYAVLNVGHSGNPASDTNVTALANISGALEVSGGTVLVGSSNAMAAYVQRGGTVRFQNQTGTITAFTGTGGTTQWASTATITAMELDGGTFDASYDTNSSFTITAADVYAGSTFKDPYSNASSSDFQLRCEPGEVKLELGGTSNGPIDIDL
jgi:hypothetical protein